MSAQPQITVCLIVKVRERENVQKTITGFDTKNLGTDLRGKYEYI